MLDTQKRTWAEISLQNLEHNYKEIRSRLPEGCLFLATVKANAYGHGVVPVAKTFERLGADYFSVACLDEARELREHTKLPILILGCTPVEYTEELIALGITQAVNSTETAKGFSAEAEKLGKKLKVHIAADTGMGRIGINCRGENDGAAEIAEIARLSGLDAEGIFTHFAVSDVRSNENDTFTQEQFDNFSRLILKLDNEYGVKFAIRHCANSGALINWKCAYGGVMNMARPGIILYGLYPDKERGGLDLRPVMQLKTRVAQVQPFERGASVSYGRTWQSEKDGRIAVLPIGYADGFLRVYSNKLEVLLHGKRVPLIGRVCMDMTMADVSLVPEAKVGDVVTIFGRDGESFIPVEELSDTAGTISYETVCGVSARVPRVYDRNVSEL